MRPKTIKREVDPANENGTGYKRPEEEAPSDKEKILLRERLAGQHEMMNGSSPDLECLDRTDKSSWPDIECVDTEPSILPE